MKFTFKISVVAFGQLALSVERVLVVMVLSRTLALADYGTYQQVWLVYSLALPLFTLGLPGSVLYFIPRADLDQRKTVAVQTLLLLQVIGLAFSLATFASAPLMARMFNNQDLVLYLRIFSLYPLLAIPPKLVNLLLIAEDRPGLATTVSSLSALTTLLFLTMPSLVKLPLVYTFYSADVGALLFFVGVVIFLIRFYRKQHFRWDLPLLGAQLAYALPLGLSSVLGVISRQLDKAVISSMFTPAVYALYANGAYEVPVIGLLTGSLMTVLIPEFVKRLRQESSQTAVWSLWNTATRNTAFILFPIAVALFVFAPELMVFLFSDKYLGSAGIFRIYLALAILRITQYGALLQAMGYTRLILGTSALMLTLNLFLSWSLAHLLGVKGPAWANVATNYAWALVYLVMLCHLLKTPFRRIMPWRQLAGIMGLAIAPGLLAWLTKALPLGHVSMLAVGSTVYAMGYLIMLLITNTLSMSQVRTAIQGVIRGGR
jgi:O-antigen/teichoic acid export membrane protein